MEILTDDILEALCASRDAEALSFQPKPDAGPKPQA